MPLATLTLSQELRQLVTGTFVRRPLEQLLMRLTALQLQSQPPHLRHLVMVRDTILSGTIPLYVQYSLPNFEARVKSGQAFWEAVKGPAIDSENRGKKTSSNHALISLNVPELDEFGFPAKYAPSSQYKGARTTLGQGLLAARPDNLPFSNRDPTVCDNGSFEYKIKYNAAEASTNSVRPATQDGLAEGDSSTPSGEKSTIKHNSRPVQASLRPRGRPRKFLKGTEKFWQGQFAMARTLANQDQPRILDSKAGAMSDPAGLSLFSKRPPQFDVTLVRALESGLPVPAKPKDITQEWVDKMSPILNRTVPSAHVTPEGVRLQGSGKHAGVSRLLILRSSRLGNLQFSERREVPAVRFLVSSAAHTFVDLKCEVFVETVDDDRDDFYASSSSTRAQHAPRNLEIVTRGKQDGPRDPICRTPGESLRDRTFGEKEAGTTALSPRTKRQGRPRKVVKISTSGTASSRKRNSASKRQESASILAAPIDPFGLPPPAMTRSALRKRQRAVHGASFDEDFNLAVSPAIGKQRNDPAERLVEEIKSQSEPKSSSHLDKVSILEARERAKTPPGKQFTPAVARTQSGLGSTATESGAGRDILGITGPAPRQLESSLTSSRSPLVRLRTTAPPWTTGSEDEYMLETSQGPLDSLNMDDRDSEAFRLVQELMANGTEQAQEVEGATLTDRIEQRVPTVASSDADEDVNLPKSTVSDEHSDPEASCKRSKDDVVGAGSVAILRRKIVLDLMEACSGALPYYSNSLWSPFTTAWQKAGQSGKPDMRTIKAAVKSLCQNGSAKQIRFSHRNKRGVMVTKTILAKADIAASNEIILEIQKRMMETDPRPYLPEALEVDSELKRDMGRQRSIPWPAVFEERTVQPSVTPAKVLRLQLRETLSCARRKQRSTDLAAEGLNKGRDPQSDLMVSRPRLGGTRRKYTRRSEPYPRPKLSMDHHPRPPQQQLSDKSPASPDPLDFRTESSPVPLIFDASAAPKPRASKSQAAIPPHSSKDAKATSQLHFINDTQNLRPLQPVSIIWTKTGDQPVLPSSLEDILSDDHRRSKEDDAKWGDPATRDFEWTVDGVASWEQRSPNLFDFKSTNWVFINHSVGDTFKAAPGVGSRIRFDGLIWYDQRGRGHTEKRFHAYEESNDTALVKERRAILRRERQKVARQTQSELIAAQPLCKRKRVSVDPLEATKKRRRGKSPLTQPQTITDSAGNLIDVSHLIGAKYRRPRGIQHLRTMPEHLIYKLAVTVVVVRALAGGLEKHIDWPLVMSVFPNDDEQFLKDRWKTLSNKHRRDIDQLFENFQDRFPGAYAQGEVQHINFDDLESVDWESLVQWALNNLDKRIIHDIPELPASRSELDETVSLRIERNHRPYRDLFGYNQAVTVPMKEAAISAIPFAVPLPLASPASHPNPPHPLDPKADNYDPALKLAKSWALSTITTPLLTFDAAKAQSKLQSLAPVASESETLIESAMKLLSSTKAVSKKRDKGTDAKGRSYDLSRVFTDTLDQRRSINATMLKQAARYKTSVLDAAFAKCEVAEFQPVSVEDGDMVAILNLSAHGRIKIKIGPDVPRNRWGIDEDSRYQTRNIKKESLYFAVLMQQIPGKYVFGNPLLKKDVRVPDLGNGDRDLIPIWRDIRGGFQRGSWDLALAAVLGILASRPGADVREVAQTMSPALQAWEVESLLAWCLEVGAVRRTGQDEEGGWTGGWEVREWWWMVLECGML
jgi:hypothetical protein